MSDLQGEASCGRGHLSWLLKERINQRPLRMGRALLATGTAHAKPGGGQELGVFREEQFFRVAGV